MDYKNNRLIFIALIALLIPGCGGGGGGNGDSGKAAGNDGPDGVWRGTLTVDAMVYDDFFAIFDGGYFIGYSESAGELVEGYLAVNNSALSGTLSEYQIPGTYVSDIEVTGAIESGQTFTASSGVGIIFDLTFDDLYNRTASFEKLAGTWVHQNAGYILTTTIQLDGSFAAVDTAGCSFSGMVSIPDVQRNGYKLTYNAKNCGSGNGSYSGMAVLDDLDVTDDVMHIVAKGPSVAFAGVAQKQDDPPGFHYRTTNALRTINDGDYLEYNVTGQVANNIGQLSIVTGLMRVEWFDDQLAEPLSGVSTIPVLREVTTLTLDQEATTYTSVRYLQQQPNGLKVLAFSGVPDLLWAGSDSAPDDGAALMGFTSMPSPVPTSAERLYTFPIWEGCQDAPVCASKLMTFNDFRVFVSDAPIMTDLGGFSSIYIGYSSGGFSPDVSTMPALVDIRGYCDSTSAHFDGAMFVFPQIGVVYWENSCTALDGSGYSSTLTGSLSATNIDIPETIP
jgi:hypothetical protein